MSIVTNGLYSDGVFVRYMTYRHLVATANGDGLAMKLRFSSGDIGCHTETKRKNEYLEGKG
jgi:hypothetical protein